jgi:hypothetical protein
MGDRTLTKFGLLSALSHESICNLLVLFLTQILLSLGVNHLLDAGLGQFSK